MAAQISPESKAALVRTLLFKNWDEDPDRIEENDLQAVTQLFTNLALKKELPQVFKTEFKFSDGRAIFEETPVVRDTDTKIKHFVRKFDIKFWTICNTGIPFSHLPTPVANIAEAALDHALDPYSHSFSSRYDSIIYYLMHYIPDHMTEKELISSFGEIFDNLDIVEIQKTCTDLACAYDKGDNKAGYYLLWVIKYKSGCNFEIPLMAEFNESTVRQVLSQFISTDASLKDPTSFIEILLFTDTTPLYKQFIDSDSNSHFLSFVISHLKSIPLDKWSNKGAIITDLLTNLIDKRSFASDLQASTDSKTAQIGDHTLKALESTSLNNSIPHLNALSDLLPYFNDNHAERIFKMPFVQFKVEDLCNSELFPVQGVKLLSNLKDFFVRGNFIYGIKEPIDSDRKTFTPHLLAYNMQTKRIQWGVPIIFESESPKELSQWGENILICDEQRALFIDSTSEEIIKTITLPHEMKGEYDQTYFPCDTNFMYQKVGLDLIGGELSDSEFKLTFKAPFPVKIHSFIPLSTHIGIFDDLENKLYLFAPSGKHVDIDCVSTYAEGDKLYLLEPGSEENTFRLTIRTLKTEGDQVVSEPEKSIDIKSQRPVLIKKLCENGQLILLEGWDFRQNIIFIKLNSDEVVYNRKHTIPNFVIDASSAVVWSWDSSSQELRRISSEGAVSIGDIDLRDHRTFSNDISQNGLLCLIDR